jgi:hypothetical protein
VVEDVGFICDFGLGLEVIFTGDFGGLEADDLDGVVIEGLRDLALAAILDDSLVGGGVV